MRTTGAFWYMVATAHLGVVALAASASSSESPRAFASRSMALAQRQGAFSTTGSLPVVTGEQLALTNSPTTLESLRRVRPDYLRVSQRARGGARAVELTLFVDGLFYGDIALLDAIAVTEIRTISFLHPSDAAMRFGSFCKCDGGVLAVTTRRVGDR